jgi:hypothetical protein
MLYENFVITDGQFLQPCYRISPFKSKDIIKNSKLRLSENIDEYFTKRFNNKKYIYT